MYYYYPYSLHHYYLYQQHFYKYPYEFEKIKKCLQEKYNVPRSIAENMINIAQYGYEIAGWSDKKILLNKLSGEWRTNLGILKLHISEDLVLTDDTIFPYANKVTGRIEGSVNWRGVSSGVLIGLNTQGEFEIKFEEDSNLKRTFSGTFTENGEDYKWKGKQTREY